jgi:DNA-binding SARP family transcriptional activator
VPPLRIRRWPWPIRIRTLGGFQLTHDDVPIEFSGKGPGRPIELLKVLVALGGRDVRSDQLADALWPHAEADFAYQSFTATLHRLRRTLRSDDALILSDGRLTLDRTKVWVDTWTLEQSCDAFDVALRGVAPGTLETVLRGFAEEVREVYRGPFLPDESEQPAYTACREQVRSRILRLLARVARGFEEAGSPHAGTDWYLRFIEADELYEPLHRHLMLSLQRRGDVAEALATYERLRTMLAVRAKTMPSSEIQALYASLKLGAVVR